MKKYFVLHPATFKLDGGAMFGIIPKPLWEKKIPSDELNRIHLSLRVMLIQTKNKNILVDTGIGDYHGDKFDDRFAVKGEKHPLLLVLKKNFNLLAEDISDIIITHLHFDHVGGLGEDENNHQEIFPKAKLHIHKKHYEYSLNPTVRDSGSFHSQFFKPLIEKADSEGRVIWHHEDQGVVLEDEGEKISYRVSFGHTPYLLHPYDDKFIYMADLVPTSSHLSIPWVMGYDISPGQTTKDKMAFYEFIANQKLTMIFEHDMKYWGARIQFDGNDVKSIELEKANNQEFQAILQAWPALQSHQ